MIEDTVFFGFKTFQRFSADGRNFWGPLPTEDFPEVFHGNVSFRGSYRVSYRGLVNILLLRTNLLTMWSFTPFAPSSHLKTFSNFNLTTCPSNYVVTPAPSCPSLLEPLLLLLSIQKFPWGITLPSDLQPFIYLLFCNIFGVSCSQQKGCDLLRLGVVVVVAVLWVTQNRQTSQTFLFQHFLFWRTAATLIRKWDIEFPIAFLFLEKLFEYIFVVATFVGHLFCLCLLLNWMWSAKVLISPKGIF